MQTHRLALAEAGACRRTPGKCPHGRPGSEHGAPAAASGSAAPYGETKDSEHREQRTISTGEHAATALVHQTRPGLDSDNQHSRSDGERVITRTSERPDTPGELRVTLPGRAAQAREAALETSPGPSGSAADLSGRGSRAASGRPQSPGRPRGRGIADPPAPPAQPPTSATRRKRPHHPARGNLWARQAPPRARPTARAELPPSQPSEQGAG